MTYLDENSLFRTVDRVSEAFLYNRLIEHGEKSAILNFLVDRQGKPGSYADTFAPTEEDLSTDLILFTGERIRSSAGKCHMIGEEACRVLRLLDNQSKRVKETLQKAETGLMTRISEVQQHPDYIRGTYCCKTCSCALWLNITSGGLGNDSEMLQAGLVYLHQHRDQRGRWKGFPGYYTLYVLNEMDPELAMDEIRYAAQFAERRLKRKTVADNQYDLRRNYICKQILKKAYSA